MAYTGAYLFDECTVKEQKTASRVKGRSSDLLHLRNEQIIARLYYYRNYTDKRNDAIVKQLTIEFHLSESRIFDVIADNAPRMREMKDQRPSLKWFRDQWPHWQW